MSKCLLHRTFTFFDVQRIDDRGAWPCGHNAVAKACNRPIDSAPAVPATTNLQTASGGRFVGDTGCEAAGMAGMVMLAAPFGGMIVGALTTDPEAAAPGAAALLLDDVREPDGAPAGAAAGAAAAPMVPALDEVPEDPAGVLAAAFARAAAVAAAAAAAPGRAAPVPLAGAVAGLASVTQHAGAAASRSSRQVTAARGRDAIVVIVRPSTAPRCCTRPVRGGSEMLGLDVPSCSESSCGRAGCRRQAEMCGDRNMERRSVIAAGGAQQWSIPRGATAAIVVATPVLSARLQRSATSS